jgi:hypothetical protein
MDVQYMLHRCHYSKVDPLVPASSPTPSARDRFVHAAEISTCTSWSKSTQSSIGVDAYPWGATPSVPAKCAELFTYRLGDE